MVNTMLQAARFGVVGVLATLTHIAVAIAIVELVALPVFWANIGAFCVAAFVSYGGNHRWTFGRSGCHARYLPRFLSIAGLGLALGQIMVWAITEAGGHYRVAIVTVAVTVPVFTFLASRFFVFAEPRDEFESAAG